MTEIALSVPPRRLRVCHIMTADLWAGAEVQVATLASYLVERPDVALTVVLFNEGRLADELRRLAVTVVVIDERSTGALGILVSLVRLLNDHEFDIVHTHRYKDTILGAIAARIANVPHLIRTVHGLNEAMRGWSRAKLQAYQTLERAVLRRSADRIVAVSARIARTLAASGYRPSAITCIHNGVDLNRMASRRTCADVRRELGIEAGVVVAGTVGRLSPVKGHIHFLRAARLVLDRVPAARFLIVGGGPLHDELTAAAADLGIDRECLFLGPRIDVHDLVAAMDVFVLPSLDEGIPLALLEAMAIGRPVVATAVGGVPEVVTPGSDGLLVPPGDDRALADACLKLAANPELARTLGERAIQTVRERFSGKRNGDVVMDVYRQVAVGPTASSIAGRLDPTVWGILSRLAASVVHHARRRFDHALTRRRMRRLRRNPAQLVARLRRARNILVVCQGNIIRSPFAACMIARETNRGIPVSVWSRGLEAVAGKPSHPTAVLTAAAMDVDLRQHAAAPVTPDAVAAADIVFVMDVPQVADMVARFPDAREKTFLLTCLAPDAPLEIADPYAGDDSQFQACYEHICRSVRPLIRTLSQAVPRAHIVGA